MILNPLLPSRHRRRQPTKPAAVAVSSPSVPAELYRPIIEAVESPRDLYKLLFVSKAIHAESERVLYYEITMKSWTLKASLRLFKHLSKCQRVAFYVRRLSIDSLRPKDCRRKVAEEYFRTMNVALRALQYLEELFLENGFYTKKRTWIHPSFSVLAGCTFQLKWLFIIRLCESNRTDLENQKYIESLNIHVAESNSLSQLAFPRLSTLYLIKSRSSPDLDSIQRIDDLFIDGFSLRNNATFQSPLVKITSLVLCEYDPSVVDLPYLFPSVRFLQLFTRQLTLTVLEGYIEQLRRLSQLQRVYFAFWIEKELPTQSIVSQWLSKLINVKRITITDDPLHSDDMEWVRGAKQWESRRKELPQGRDYTAFSRPSRV